MKQVIYGAIILILLSSCSSNPPMDLTNTSLYIHPIRKPIDNTGGDIFTKAERAKAMQWAKDNRINLMFLVVVDENDNIVKRKVVKRGRGLDITVVSHYKMQLTESKISMALQKNGDQITPLFHDGPTAFYFPLTIEQSVEIEYY